MRQTRRTFLRHMGVGALAGAAALGRTVMPEGAAQAAAASAMAGAKPNIVLILTDDQGVQDVSCHGHPHLKTPNMDRLAREGVSFTNFHVSPTCSPTRSAIMSGTYPFYCGVTHTIHARERLNKHFKILPQVLKDAGYATGIFGKWHLGDTAGQAKESGLPYRPDHRGFDEVFVHGGGGIGQRYDYGGDYVPGQSYFNPTLFHNGTMEKTEGFCTDVFFRQAIEWIGSVKDRPFFAYIPTNAPHGPLRWAPEDAQKPYKNLAGRWREAPIYYGMVANIDENIGRLLAFLKDQGLDDKTLVLFVTDNGHTGGAVRAYSMGLRGGKGSPYEGGTRAVSFWRWPGRLPAGTTVGTFAAHIDLLPTFAELAGAALPTTHTVHGRSLVPLLADPKAPWKDRYHFVHRGRWAAGGAARSKFKGCAVRKGRFKLVDNTDLYDLEADPGEKRNVLKDHPDVVADLRAAYDAWWDEALTHMVNEKGS